MKMTRLLILLSGLFLAKPLARAERPVTPISKIDIRQSEGEPSEDYTHVGETGIAPRKGSR